MKILVIGGCGYIGSHIVLEAIKAGHEVVVFDDLSNGSKENIDNSITFFKGSTLSESDLSEVMSSHCFDSVIHLAAYKAAGESMTNPSKYANNNIIGGINLIKACIQNNIDKFIFSSTAAIYGDPEYSPIDELHSQKPLNYYGYTKLAIERNLKWFSDLEGLKYCTLRYFNAAGYDIHKRIKGREKNPQNLIPIVVEVALGDKKSLDVYGNDYSTKDGTGVRDYIHVSDLAMGHIASLDYLSKHNKNLIINLGTGEGHSVLDVINMTKKISNKNIEYNFTKRRKGDPDTVIADSEKAKKLINWQPKYSDLYTIIDSTWKIYNY
tara:strand:+ start:182 stop:1150 length:969 start_codon:yes stop_codon:yes gene_type:complete